MLLKLPTSVFLDLPRAPRVVVRVEEEEHGLHDPWLPSPLARELGDATSRARLDQELVEVRLLPLRRPDLAAAMVVAVAKSLRQVAEPQHHRLRLREVWLAAVERLAPAAGCEQEEQQREAFHTATSEPAKARRS